jgi:perosamine synthetase
VSDVVKSQSSVSDVGMNRLACEGGSPVRTAPWPARRMFGEEERQAVIDLMDESIRSGNTFGYEGSKEQAYCQEFVDAMGGGYADAVNSGTNAVFIALRMLNLPIYSEVIVPPCSDPGGIMPVAMLGCIPIVSDAQPRSYNMGAREIERRITPRTSAILVAHIAGQAADMDGIMAVARAHKLPVIEDCAQSHGATYRGKPVGIFGDVAAFSTMFGKHHATGSQGGVVYTRQEDLYWHGRRIADRGKAFNMPGEGGNVIAALNMNQNELAMAIGLPQLRKLPANVENRRRFVRQVVELTAGLKTVRPITSEPGTESSYWFLFLELDLERVTCSKQQFAAAIEAEGIPMTATYFATPCKHRWFLERQILGQPGWPWTSAEYQGDANAVHETPVFDATAARWLRLNMHEQCGQQEATDLAAALSKVEARYART